MWQGPIRGPFLAVLALCLCSPDTWAQTTEVVCSASPCVVVVQLDAAQALAQVSDWLPEWHELAPLFWACVGMLLVGFTVRMAGRTLQ